MAQIETGLRRFLGYGLAYRAFQSFVRRSDARAKYVRDYIRPEPGSRILDLGCGPATILDYYPQTVRYVGVDSNAEYIREARIRYGDRASFYVRDLREPIVLEGEFDLITALGFLHHLDDEAARTLLRAASRKLAPQGRLITTDPVICREAGVIGRWIISKDRGQNVRTPDGYKSLALSCFDDVKGTIRTDLLRIPYAHFIMEMRTLVVPR